VSSFLIKKSGSCFGCRGLQVYRVSRRHELLVLETDWSLHSRRGSHTVEDASVLFYPTNVRKLSKPIEYDIRLDKLKSVLTIRIDEFPNLGGNFKIIQQVKKIQDQHHGSLADATVIKLI